MLYDVKLRNVMLRCIRRGVATRRDATRRDATRRDATRRDTAMQCNAMQCNAMQCNAMQCNAMQCNAMQCNAMQNTTKYYRIVLRCCVVYSYPFFIIVFFIYKIPYLSLSCLRYRAATPRRIQPISTEVDRASPASVLRHKPAASQSPTLFGRARLWRRLTSKSRRRRVLGPVRQRECRR